MSRANIKGSHPRFSPSRQDVAIYRTLIAAQRPLSTQDMIEQGCAGAPTIRHTCQWWTERGLLKRTFLDRIAWYEWKPNKAARKYTEALADALTVYEQVPPLRPTSSTSSSAPGKAGDSVVRFLRALAQALADAAERLEKSD